jgi:hypothetical protein
MPPSFPRGAHNTRLRILKSKCPMWGQFTNNGHMAGSCPRIIYAQQGHPFFHHAERSGWETIAAESQTTKPRQICHYVSMTFHSPRPKNPIPIRQNTNVQADLTRRPLLRRKFCHMSHGPTSRRNFCPNNVPHVHKNGYVRLLEPVSLDIVTTGGGTPSLNGEHSMSRCF